MRGSMLLETPLVQVCHVKRLGGSSTGKILDSRAGCHDVLIERIRASFEGTCEFALFLIESRRMTPSARTISPESQIRRL